MREGDRGSSMVASWEGREEEGRRSGEEEGSMAAAACGVTSGEIHKFC